MDSQVTIRGNVGSTVAFKSGESDGRKWSRAEFRLGSTRRVRRADGTWADAGTTWITVQAWSTLAEGIRGSVDKGDPVIAAGWLRTDEWHDANGEIQSRLTMVADTVGHDLSRGRTRFVRNAPIPVPEPLGDDRAPSDVTPLRPEGRREPSGPEAEEATDADAEEYDALAPAVGD